jgi:hypothetical protein
VYVWPQVPERVKNARVLRWLAFLGRHSLQVFAWSILMTYVSMALMPAHPSRLWRALDMLFTVSSLAIPARLHAWATQRGTVGPTRPLSSASY